MYPFTSSLLTADLTNERLPRRLRGAHRHYRYDPDQFLEEPALQPDPISMGFRQVLAGGLIGRLVRWFERRAEAREERAFTQRGDAGATQTAESTIAVLATATDNSDEERTAA